MDNVCRTCLSSSDQFESVFVKKLVNAEYTSLATMISACTGLEVSEYDSISCVICKDCIDFIVVAFKYRKQCWKSHMHLMSQFKMQYEMSRQELKTRQKSIEDFNSENEKYDDQWLTPEPDIFLDIFDVNTVIQKCTKATASKSSAPKRKRPSRIKYDENGLPQGYGDMIEHTLIVTDETDNNKMYMCSFCNFKYKRIASLRAHQEKIHHLHFKNDYECNQCGKLFVSQKKLNFHIRVHDDNQFVCQFCGKRFRLNSALMTHVRRHTGDKPFGCDQCDFHTITKSDLVTHKRTHTGEKPFKCYHCNAAFSTFSHRAAHVRQHSDERPFKCIICKTAYKSRGVYKSHMDSHDQKKSIVCEICKHISSNRKNHNRHVKLHRNK